MEFEWDPATSAATARRRGIGFDRAAEIFMGKMVQWTDDRNDYGEQRVRAVEEAYKDLLIINDIRNAFAHSLHQNIDFSNSHIKDDCDRLEYLKRYSPLGSPQPPSTPILIFVETVRALYTGFRRNAEKEIAFVTGFVGAATRIIEADQLPRAADSAPSRRRTSGPSRRNRPT